MAIEINEATQLAISKASLYKEATKLTDSEMYGGKTCSSWSNLALRMMLIDAFECDCGILTTAQKEKVLPKLADMQDCNC